MNPIIFVMVLLVILTFTIGLNLKKEDFILLIKKPIPVITGLTGQILALPLIAVLIAKIFNLEEVFFIGLVLIALCPGGSSSNIFTLIAKGDLALSVSLTALSSVIFVLFKIVFALTRKVEDHIFSFKSLAVADYIFDGDILKSCAVSAVIAESYRDRGLSVCQRHAVIVINGNILANYVCDPCGFFAYGIARKG